jgi:hypothetical protein
VRLNNFFSKYPAIWKSNTVVNSNKLLEEFLQVLSSRLQKVYSNNIDWTGVTVFDGSYVNYLNDLPCLNELLDQIGLESVLGASYFNLAPNSHLHRHRDMNGNLLFGVLRLHIPLQTNLSATIEVKKISYHLPVNTMWVLDTSGEHALENMGSQNRIHLVIDVKHGKSTKKYFPSMTPGIVLHLVLFFCIMIMKILRDSFIHPISLLNRFIKIFNKRIKK